MTKIKYYLVFFFLYIIIVYYPIFTEDKDNTPLSDTLVEETSSSDDDLATELAIRAQMAMATPDYLVTPGDIYTYGFLAGSRDVTTSFIIDSTYRVRVVNLGMVNAEGLSLLELKKKVEALINKNYPLSGVQFALTTPATFNVTVRGEVLATTTISVWGLSRLSDTLKNMTKNASLRDIEVTSSIGKTRTYDYFSTQRFGDLTQNPYLRPGDVITIKKCARSVTLKGAVNRPGTYQLLEGENLAELITRYGDGFTPVAAPGLMELVRYVDTGSASGNKLFFDEKAIEENLALKNLDSVFVHSRQDLIPVMYLEGAIGKIEIDPETKEETIKLDSDESYRLPVRFNPGENYASLVRNNSKLFTSFSDTKNAYIQRSDKRIPINLNPILYDPEYRSDQTVENGDTLVLPLRQFYVTVTGAVIDPGRYPYVPNRDWEYYVSLAGGIDKERNSFKILTIKDVQGKEWDKADPVPPEAIIDAKNSSFLYYFNRYAPVAVTVLSAIVTYYTVKDAIERH